jgi:gluconokinase
MGVPFIDGDDLHGRDNVAKMARGEPLDDADRSPWLDRIGSTLADRNGYPNGLVVSCSALRRRYRDTIRSRAGPSLRIVFLDGKQSAIRDRLNSRRDHFMPPALLQSQFDALERPLDEPDVVSVSITGLPEAIADQAIAGLL